uniref:DNA-directed DNA polymerase n=1 Tax=Aureoumbra lagunensis TaxID=44058 RepID=A0A7S3NGU9_9STRA
MCSKLRILLIFKFFVKTYTKSVGVCWTRSAVAYNPKKLPDYGIKLSQFEEVVASLLTIKRGVTGLKTCLFTEASSRAVSYAVNALLKQQYLKSMQWRSGISITYDQVNFDFVIPSADGTKTAREVLGKERAATMKEILDTYKAHRSGSLWTKAHALVARLANLARSPFDITLFLDTDTALCPSATLPQMLKILGRNATLRLAELPASKGKPSAFLINTQSELRHMKCMSQRCAHCTTFRGWNTQTDLLCIECSLQCEETRGIMANNCSSFSEQPPPLQVGSMIITRSPELSQLVDTWIQAYFNVFAVNKSNLSNPLYDVYGNDQVPLNRIVASMCSERYHVATSFTVKQLSPGFNFRAFAFDSNFVVAGRVTVLHSHGIHNYENKAHGGLVSVVKRICNELNPAHGLGLRHIRHGQYNDPEHISLTTKYIHMPS